MGYIITLGSTPLLWKSQLISEIWLSTLHSEYVALSMSLRSLIPIRNTIMDMLNFLKIKNQPKPVIYCDVFEDNQGAYLLATNQRITTRTKYFCVKLHFFWQYVYHPTRNPSGWLKLSKCSTDLQNADYTTKGLPKPVYEANRKRVQGW